MNAVEIEEAISELAGQPFDRAEFPYLFLGAFGNKEVTLKRLRTGNSNASDVPEGILQRNHIHIATCDIGKVDETITLLRDSPKTAALKAKFILATDGETFQAEDVTIDDAPIACEYANFHDHFGFFLPLAGITTVKQIRESSFDIKATGRLNKLYLELLKDNADWAKAERRPDMNHFMARLIFCFFAEDTDIFRSTGLFTATVSQMSASDSSNTHEIITNIFRAMNTKPGDRAAAGVPAHADGFPYVNGGLFSGSTDVPRFSKIARSYLLNIGSLDWTKINPDIFGSMIQAVADDDERGSLGMHYTSVPNILKVLNPLFLDDLREQLNEAGDNARMLLNLRKRMAKIRVFDPACGSGNFLVIAYKQMRAIEFEINTRRGEPDRRTDLPLTNYRGIELRDFPAEIARLALIIAEYQCDVTYRGQKEALAEFLPLDAQNWITCGNALRLDWLSICPPTGTGVKVQADDLFGTPLDQAEIDFENEGGETYICGNPPYVGATTKPPKGANKELRERLKKEDESRKSDLKSIFDHRTTTWQSLAYVVGWFMKASDYGRTTNAKTAFVSTNSICQGQQVATLWPLIYNSGHEIYFAHTSFLWKNLAANNAGVTVIIVGLSIAPLRERKLFDVNKDDLTSIRSVENINAYLVPANHIIIEKAARPMSGSFEMSFGNKPTDGGWLILDRDEVKALHLSMTQRKKVVRRFLGSEDSINGKERFCLWLTEEDARQLSENSAVTARLAGVRKMRLDSDKQQTRELAKLPFKFGEIRQSGKEIPFIIPRVSSESREYLPFVMGHAGDIVSDTASALYDVPLWNIALYASRLHLIWIATVCGKLKSDFRYSNTLGWNTFPIPVLTEQNKADLTRCAENILLAREAHYPATIADLYDPDAMPDNLRRAHDANDALLESIYIGRRFKNDTERLEKLFELYTRMTASDAGKAQTSSKKSRHG
jgi:hypothetical protein